MEFPEFQSVLITSFLASEGHWEESGFGFSIPLLIRLSQNWLDDPEPGLFQAELSLPPSAHVRFCKILSIFDPLHWAPSSMTMSVLPWEPSTEPRAPGCISAGIEQSQRITSLQHLLKILCQVISESLPQTLNINSHFFFFFSFS